jgi:hypothetical protein
MLLMAKAVLTLAKCWHENASANGNVDRYTLSTLDFQLIETIQIVAAPPKELRQVLSLSL